jgi:hypothetical protein
VLTGTGFLRRANRALVALLLFCPLVGYGADLDIPEIGVYLARLPDGSTKSQLFESLDASSIGVRIGSVTLFIQRLDDPVPAGASVTEPAYLKALQENFGDDLGAKADGQATTVSGRAAWTLYSAVRSPDLIFVPPIQPVARFASYTCVTYVIANEHAYRLRANATAPYDPHAPNVRPPDFVAAVQAIFDITFQPVVGPPASADKLARVKHPRMIVPPMDLYPAPARRLNEEGVVDVEYSIDGNGHARDVKQLYASSPHLGTHLPEYLKSAAFRVPTTWEQTGSQNERYTMEFQFALSPPQGCSATSLAAPRIPEATVIAVCSSRLPGAPVTH